VRISMPVDAVGNNDEIFFDEDNSNQISIVYGGEDRRELELELESSRDLQGVQTYNVLVIRVSDDKKAWKSVAQTESQLYNDIFGANNNNLKTVFETCSNNKVQINPAAAGGNYAGVITIPTPSNVCTLTYSQVGAYAVNHAKVKNLTNGGSITHKMIVMPNSNCVDFKSAAAWGKVNGDSTYLQAKYASKPAVHVHEFGHNLGMQHSGQWSNGELNAYGDQSGYMGGNTGMAWDDEGAHMCFNAAKMYYSNWYSDQQKIVYPANGAFSTKLVALDDIRTDKDNTDASIVLATTGASGSRVFLMYNKAKGMTADVGDKDTVTIIRQSGSSAKSEQVGALKTNDEKKNKQLEWRKHSSDQELRDLFLQWRRHCVGYHVCRRCELNFL
jgi:hypothetical protein